MKFEIIEGGALDSLAKTFKMFTDAGVNERLRTSLIPPVIDERVEASLRLPIIDDTSVWANPGFSAHSLSETIQRSFKEVEKKQRERMEAGATLVFTLDLPSRK